MAASSVQNKSSALSQQPLQHWQRHLCAALGQRKQLAPAQHCGAHAVKYMRASAAAAVERQTVCTDAAEAPQAASSPLLHQPRWADAEAFLGGGGQAWRRASQWKGRSLEAAVRPSPPHTASIWILRLAQPCTCYIVDMDLSKPIDANVPLPHGVSSAVQSALATLQTHQPVLFRHRLRLLPQSDCISIVSCIALHTRS